MLGVAAAAVVGDWSEEEGMNNECNNNDTPSGVEAR